MKKQFLSFTLLLALSTWIAQAATVMSGENIA